jgi:hypothetical protein
MSGIAGILHFDGRPVEQGAAATDKAEPYITFPRHWAELGTRLNTKVLP